MADSSSSGSTTGGIGFTGALFLVFLVLKLTGHIAWSWWWVTAPLWGAFGLFGVFALFCLAMALLAGQLGNGGRG